MTDSTTPSGDPSAMNERIDLVRIRTQGAATVEELAEVFRDRIIRQWKGRTMVTLLVITLGIFLVSEEYFGIFFALVFYGVFFAWSLQSATKMAQKLEILREECRMTFDDNGLLMEGERGRWQLLWRDFTEWDRTKKSFVLLHPGGMIRVIPDRLLGPAGVAALTTLLKHHFPPK